MKKFLSIIVLNILFLLSFFLLNASALAETKQNKEDVVHVFERETSTETTYRISDIEKEFIHQPTLPSGSAIYGQNNKRRTQGIIGADDRWTVPDAGVYPYCAIARMTLYYGDISVVGYGTGFIVGPKLLATAGHVLLYEDSAGRIHYPTGITMELMPYGSRTPYTVTSYHSIIYYGDYTGFNENTDYGFVYLNSNIESVTGSFGIRMACDPNQAIFAAGYPFSNRSMIHVSSGNVTSYTEDLMIHNADIEAGESGGPVYVVCEGLPYAMGVNSGMAYDGNTGVGLSNSSRRINYGLFEWLSSNGYFNG